jgi:cytochrome c
MKLRPFLALLLGTVAYVGAQAPPPGSGTASPRPDVTRFEVEHVVPEGELNEPMVFAIAPDSRAYIGERHGAMKVYNPATGLTKTITTFQVFDQNEQGFIGLTLDPGFTSNRRLYVVYSAADASEFRLVRLTMTPDDDILPGSARTMLTIPVDRAGTNHTGGGMTWDAAGNLYLTVGNNTGNSQFMQSDERPGRQMADDQRGAANSNDLRGKILRIHPEPDGTYTTPAGNMFPPGTPNTRPEIYTMGHRNVWRVSLDSRTGHIYWGEIGPDQATDTPTAPRGYDEFNRATRPGFFGWPYFVGDNQPLRYADYVANTFGGYKDPQRPTNTSVNNTGIRELPPAQPAMIFYPFAISDRFPELGSGARCAVGGPVYRRADFAPTAARPWPAYYEGKWLITDCTRAWVKSVTMTDAGEVRQIEDVVPDVRVAEPMDIKFGPEGDLYVLDYGSIWNAKSPDSKLVRIKYQAGNRAPVAVASASTAGGTPPFDVTLRADGSRDFDGDALSYAWSVATPGQPARTFTGPTASVPFATRGPYTATLTVSDPAGASSTDTVEIVSGNEPPVVRINLTGNIEGNRSFFTPGRPVTYGVEVTDREDGTLGSGVSAERVALSIDYLPEGFDVATLRQANRPVDPATRFAVARALLEHSDCSACHQPAVRTRGPAMQELSAKYEADEATLTRLAEKVRNGGTGVWGVEVMPAHPAFTMHEALTVVNYMLNADAASVRVLPLDGSHTPVIPPDDPGRGALLIRAVYTDRGANGLPPQTSEATALLRAGGLSPLRADASSGIQIVGGRGAGGVKPYPGAVVSFRQVDLTGVARIGVAAQAQGGRNAEVGGAVEIRLGSPTGALLGTAQVPVGGGRGGAAAAAPAAAAPTASAAPLGGPLDGAAGGGGRGAGAAPAAGARDGGAGAAGGRGVVAPPAGARGGGGGGRGAAVGPVVRASIAVAPTTGLHDLYLVFRNDNARPTDLLMTVTDVMLFFN